MIYCAHLSMFGLQQRLHINMLILLRSEIIRGPSVEYWCNQYHEITRMNSYLKGLAYLFA